MQCHGIGQLYEPLESHALNLLDMIYIPIAASIVSLPLPTTTVT